MYCKNSAIQLALNGKHISSSNCLFLITNPFMVLYTKCDHYGHIYTYIHSSIHPPNHPLYSLVCYSLHTKYDRHTQDMN